jgi:type I site-specific restriction endonuclease
MQKNNTLQSPNFAFLEVHELQLVRLGTLAEQYFAPDPVTCLMKLRQFGELLAQLVAANAGLYKSDTDESQIKLLNRLRDEGFLPGRINQLFHELRCAGNDANHALSGDHRTALSNLKFARELGIWFHKSFGRDAERSQDYLEGFSAFLRENLNKIPALLVVTQRPRELTRAQLKELRLLLDAAGFSETHLQVAWREMTNEDIAASIIGFIRQAALGDALVPYGDRVDKAMKKILASRAWTAPQRKWLERIGQQLKVEVIVDRNALDQGQFKAQGGGFERLNKAFDGRLEEILVEINEALWQEAS